MTSPVLFEVTPVVSALSSSEEYLQTLRFMSLQATLRAEVPPQCQRNFEYRYRLLTGDEAYEHLDYYHPIQREWNKWAPELRVYLPNAPGLTFPPSLSVKPAIGYPGLIRINSNKYWWELVGLGFRLGKCHDIETLRRRIAGF